MNLSYGCLRSNLAPKFGFNLRKVFFLSLHWLQERQREALVDVRPAVGGARGDETHLRGERTGRHDDAFPATTLLLGASVGRVDLCGH